MQYSALTSSTDDDWTRLGAGFRRLDQGRVTDGSARCGLPTARPGAGFRRLGQGRVTDGPALLRPMPNAAGQGRVTDGPELLRHTPNAAGYGYDQCNNNVIIMIVAPPGCDVRRETRRRVLRTSIISIHFDSRNLAVNCVRALSEASSMPPLHPSP